MVSLTALPQGRRAQWRLARRRRGLLMSVVSALILGGIITLALASAHHASGVAHERLRLSSGTRAAFVGSDLGTGLTEQLFGMRVSNLSRESGEARLDLAPAAALSADIDHAARLNTYISLAEGLYASRGHLSLGIGDEAPAFVLGPSGAVLSFGGDAFTVALQDRSSVVGISLDATVDAAGLSVNSSPPDSGGVPVAVEIRNSSGAVVLSADASLDLDEDNAPFSVEFADGSTFSVAVGSAADALLVARVSGTGANLTSFGLRLADTGERLSLASRAALSLNASADGEVALSRPLVLFESSG